MSHSQTVNLNHLKAGFDALGLNLFSAFNAKTLAASVPDLILPANARGLLLIGNSGPLMWELMPERYFAQDHPVDQYSADSVNRLLSATWPVQSWQLLFPNNPDVNLPLQVLGGLAGWHGPSPLGIGINSRHGLWFAYRAVVTIDVEIDQSDLTVNDIALPENESPCLSCRDTPCLSACPADALGVSQSPNMSACVTYRCESLSSCASTCLARLACPIAQEYRYTEDQMAFHYDRSMLSAKQWVAG